MESLVSINTSYVKKTPVAQLTENLCQTYQHEQDMNLLFVYPQDKDNKVMHEISELHKHNTDFGEKQIVHSTKRIKCPCCKIQYSTKLQQLSIIKTHLTPFEPQLTRIQNQQQSYWIGSQIVCFFTYIKIVIIIFLIRFLLLDFGLCLKNYYLSSKKYSKIDMTQLGHLVDEDFIFIDELSFLQKFIIAIYKYDLVIYMVVLLIIVQILFFRYSNDYLAKLYHVIEKAHNFQNKYAILVKNIPLIPTFPGYQDSRYKDMPYEERLKRFFKNYITKNLILKVKSRFQNPQHTKTIQTEFQKQLSEILKKNKENNFYLIQQNIIRDVIICYDTSSITRIQQQKNFIMKQFHKNEIKSISPKINDKKYVEEILKKLNKYHLHIINQFNNKMGFSDKLPYFMGFAIVIFNYQLYKDFIIREANKKPYLFRFNNSHKLEIRPIQKPSVIQWKNFGQKIQLSDLSRIYSNLILVFILFGTFVILGQLQMYKIIPKIQIWLHFPKKYHHRIKAMIISGITFLINLLLSRIINKLVQYQKRISKTGTIISLLTKNVVTQFINSALIYYFITFITPASFLFQMKDLRQKVQSLIILPGTLKIIVDFINIKYIRKKVQFSITFKAKFQIQYNKLTERPQFDFVSHYTYYIVQLLTASFYATLTPMIIPALLIILPFKYYVDKLILFKKSSQPLRISFRVTMWAHFLMECSLLTFIIGWIIFCPQEFWTQYVKIISYICALCILLYLFDRYKNQKKSGKCSPKYKKTSKSHEKIVIQDIFFERFNYYNPWKCYYKAASQKSQELIVNFDDLNLQKTDSHNYQMQPQNNREV